MKCTLHVQGMCDHHDSMQQGQADAGCNKHQQTRAATPASHDVRSAAADARHMPADSLRSSEQSAIAHAQHMFVPSFHGSEQPAATTTQHIFPGQFQEPKQSAEAVVDAACKQRQRGLSDPHVHLSQNNRMGRATSTVTPQYLAAKDSGQDAPYGFQIAVGDSDLPYRSNAGGSFLCC